MRGNSIFAALAAPSLDQNNTSVPSLDDLPATLLESFIPGFSFIRRVLLTTLHIDITLLVTSILLLIGTLSAGKYLSKSLTSFAESYCMSSITIEPNNELYTQVMLWISGHVVTDRSRSLTARPSMGDPDVLGLMKSKDVKLEVDGKFDFSVLQAELPVQYAPFYGDHWFWHEGRLFLLRREKRDVTMSKFVFLCIFFFLPYPFPASSSTFKDLVRIHNEHH